jgi:hypothetical protein
MQGTVLEEALPLAFVTPLLAFFVGGVHLLGDGRHESRLRLG